MVTKEEIEQAVQQSQDTAEPLPENIQKVVEFMNETGGSLEDYVKLNQDYSSLNENQLLREYYENTRPHLDKEDIELLMEDFSYDEELDEPKEIRKAKYITKKEGIQIIFKWLVNAISDKNYKDISNFIDFDNGTYFEIGALDGFFHRGLIPS